MVCGSTSGAGKSTVAAALCRAWSTTGTRVAPFKAQNMSNHCAVTPDGGEIGRAQAMQALAARVETDRRMNPVLLKPSTAASSHLVVLGEEVSVTDAHGYGDTARSLRPIVLEALQSLRVEHDAVVLEGAGGAAEINLLDRDLVNLPLAAAAGVPAVLVVDIDRGGAFAAAHGTLDLLPHRLRRQVAGVVFNQFRGDPSLLEGGFAELTRRTGVPVLGVLPHLGDHLMLGVEDSLDLTTATQPVSTADRPVRVAVVRLPHLANPSDLDPLVLEPSAEVRWVTRGEDVVHADLVILPGSRATVADLAWLRERRIDQALDRTQAWVVGLCAGYQMLGTSIHDALESGAGAVSGLGLLPVRTTFVAPKTVRRSRGPDVHGYQIHWGRPEVEDGRSWLTLDDGPEGCVGPSGRVLGTSLHGILDDDAFRGRLLSRVAADRSRDYTPCAVPYAAALDAHHDHLAGWLAAHLDGDALRDIAAGALRPDEAPGW